MKKRKRKHLTPEQQIRLALLAPLVKEFCFSGSKYDMAEQTLYQARLIQAIELVTVLVKNGWCKKCVTNLKALAKEVKEEYFKEKAAAEAAANKNKTV